MKTRHFALLLSAALTGCTTTPRTDGPVLAITVDDLPVHGELPPGETRLSVARNVIAALREGGVPHAYGFINGQQVEADATTLSVLTEWSAAGLPLGNHGWSHRHLSEMSVAEFEQELVKNEPLLRRHSPDGRWRWYRYPFLDEGEDAAKRAAARAVLAKHGYRIAGVTMDFGDWQWTAPYARCAATGDQAAITRLESSFLDAARQGIGFYRTLSGQLYGRDVPYVIVLHISAFEARMLPRLLDLYRQEGFRFVPLDQAQSDPVFADDMDPSLSVTPRGLEGEANARGLTFPARTDFAPMLDAICR